MPERLSPPERIALGLDEASKRACKAGQLALQILTEAREGLLREPYLESSRVEEIMDTDDVRALVADYTLLAFQDHGDYLFPIFQFDDELSRPLEPVSKVNRILDAPNDGWGVTSWWIQPNGWLPEATAPKKLLGTSEEYIVVQLAEAVGADY